jgi:hypothetical protein
LAAGEALLRADCTWSFTLLVGGTAAKVTAGAASVRAASVRAVAVADVIGDDGKTTATAAISPSHEGISRVAHFWSAFIHPLS